MIKKIKNRSLLCGFIGLMALMPFIITGCNQGSQKDEATLVSSQWSSIELEGQEAWYSHCSIMYSSHRKRLDSKVYNYTYDFSTSAINRGTAIIYITNLSVDSGEIWEPVFLNKFLLKWNCNIVTWPSGKSEVYVRPRLALVNKRNNQVSRYEESGYGVESIRSQGNHYVRLNKDEFLPDISTGPKDAIDKMLDTYHDEDKCDYYAIVDKITVTVILKEV